MAGSTLGWSSVYIPRGQRVEFWAKLAIPGAGARLTLHTDLTPESVANPNAKHLGRTDEGVEISYKPSFEYRSSDEFQAPYDAFISAEEAVISAALQQVLDFDIAEALMVGSTKASGTGYEELPFGGKLTITKISVAAIWRLPEDTSKVGVFHLYSAINDAGIAARVRRMGSSSVPVAFRGFTVDSRAAGDQIGKYWKQVA